MPDTVRRVVAEIRAEGLFVIRGSVDASVEPRPEYIDLVVETLGSAPRLLRAAAERWLSDLWHSCGDGRSGDAPKLGGFGGEIIPPRPNPAPDAFRVRVRIASAPGSAVSPDRLLTVASGQLFLCLLDFIAFAEVTKPADEAATRG